MQQLKEELMESLLIEKIKDQGLGVTRLIMKKVDRLYYMGQYDKVMKELVKRYVHWFEDTERNFLGNISHSVNDRNKPWMWKFYTELDHGGYRVQTQDMDFSNNKVVIDFQYIF